MGVKIPKVEKQYDRLRGETASRACESGAVGLEGIVSPRKPVYDYPRRKVRLTPPKAVCRLPSHSG